VSCFVCSFHSWTYGLDSLKKRPANLDFAGHPRSGLGVRSHPSIGRLVGFLSPLLRPRALQGQDPSAVERPKPKDSLCHYC
jgi:hypothetical protein